MQKVRLYVFLILALIFLANAVSALSCGDTITESVVLTEDLSCSGDGLIIDADNIVIDGSGHTIQGDGTGNGIYIFENSGVEVKDITVRNYEFGIGLVDDNSGNLIYDNVIEGNDAGILVAVFGVSNKIHDNTLRNNGRAIAFTAFSNGNEIYDNKFIYNSDVGVRLLQSKWNVFWGNKFVSNSKHVDDTTQLNYYDKNGIGNYWDDFEKNPLYPTKYVVAGTAVDDFPFWFQAKCGDLSDLKILDIFDVTILINYIFRGGEPPAPIWAADINGDRTFNILDVTGLINHVHRGAQAPSCGLNKKTLPIKVVKKTQIK